MDGVAYALGRVKPELVATLERAASQMAGAVERLTSASRGITAIVEPDTKIALVQRRRLLKTMRRDIAVASEASRILNHLERILQDRRADVGPPELWEQNRAWKGLRWALSGVYATETAAMDLLDLVGHLDATDAVLVTGAVRRARTVAVGIREEMLAFPSLPSGDKDRIASRLYDEVDTLLVASDLLGVVEERLRLQAPPSPERLTTACALGSVPRLVALLAKHVFAQLFDLPHRRVRVLAARLVQAQRAWGSEAWVHYRALFSEVDEFPRLDRSHRTYFRPPSGSEWNWSDVWT